MGNSATYTNRTRVIFIILVIFCFAVIARLFYLQVFRHDYYSNQATANQFRSYEIPAERGQILARSGDQFLPLVLNERTYLVVSDPTVIKDKQATAKRLSEILKLPESEISEKLNVENLRYQILARGVSDEVKDQVEEALLEGEIEATFAEPISRRVYPQGSLAAQTFGFVDDDGNGRYGLEQAMNDELSGSPGRVKALTDQNGIPLLATGDNISEEPVEGTDIVTTINPIMQQQVEKILKDGLENAKSDFGDVVVIEANTGRIRAMASYPTYDPANFRDVETSQFMNTAVARPLEPGSVMKTLTVAAALEENAVYDGQTYFDPAQYVVDGFTIRNVEEDGGPQTRSIEDILRWSLNTGVTWLLMQMGGEEINLEARQTWENYMREKYRFGDVTGVEQGFEETGIVPVADEGYAPNLRFANSTFGQGVTTTPLQMAAAVNSAVNGGTYYRPTLVEGRVDAEGNFSESQPDVLVESVVSAQTSETLRGYMQTALGANSYTRPALRDGYVVGGKTGTAEVANPAGGYYDDRYNGTYVGFVGVDSAEYVIMVRINEPNIGGYAGTTAAAPVFTSVAGLLTDELGVVDGQ